MLGFSINVHFRSLLGRTYLNNMFFFSSNYRYFREMAQKLKIDLPKLNQQITVSLNQRCQVYGIKQIAPEIFLLPVNQGNEKFNKQNYFDDESLVGFTLDKNSCETIEFSLAKRIANKLNLDICLMRQKSEEKKKQQSYSNLDESEQSIVLSLTKFKQYIYREYYLKELKNKSKRKYIQSQLSHEQLITKSQMKPHAPGDYKNRIKSIRIGEQIHKNDMKNKQDQIKRWIEQGQRSFKIISANTSDKSYKSIQKFCLLFDQEVEIIQEKIIIHPKKKPIERLYAMLEFEEEIEIDAEFINKRWRRRQAEISLIRLSKEKKFNVDFRDEDPEIQKMYLSAFKEGGLPYPEQYDFLNEIEKGIEKEGITSFIRKSSEELQKNIKDNNLSEFGDEQQLTEKERRSRDKQNRRIMGLHTIQDIVEEMQSLKSREYEMQQYESIRYKQLESELKEMIQNAQQRSKLQSPKQK